MGSRTKKITREEALAWLDRHTDPDLPSVLACAYPPRIEAREEVWAWAAAAANPDLPSVLACAIPPPPPSASQKTQNTNGATERPRATERVALASVVVRKSKNEWDSAPMASWVSAGVLAHAPIDQTAGGVAPLLLWDGVAPPAGKAAKPGIARVGGRASARPTRSRRSAGQA